MQSRKDLIIDSFGNARSYEYISMDFQRTLDFLIDSFILKTGDICESGEIFEIRPYCSNLIDGFVQRCTLKSCHIRRGLRAFSFLDLFPKTTLMELVRLTFTYFAQFNMCASDS